MNRRQILKSIGLMAIANPFYIKQSLAESNQPTLPKFALNRITAPHLSLGHYLDLCHTLGIDNIELRNDIAGSEIQNTKDIGQVAKTCQSANIKVLTVNALYPMDIWNDELKNKAITIAAAAQQLGAKGVVCCPSVEPDDKRSSEEKAAGLRHSLDALAKIFHDHNVMGYIEPLGFTQSSLRRKKTALQAISDVGGNDVFRLVHDTFHHFLAQDPDYFVDMTAIVHISGVDDKNLPIDAIRNEDRTVVDPQDIMSNIQQLKELRKRGYKGDISHEIFSPNVQNDKNIASRLNTSMEYIRSSLA